MTLPAFSNGEKGKRAQIFYHMNTSADVSSNYIKQFKFLKIEGGLETSAKKKSHIGKICSHAAKQ